MGSTNFAGLYLYAFVFGVFLGVLYDIMWVFRVSFLRNRLVWLTDILATLSAGILLSVLQYNFSSGKFRFLPFLIFPLGVLVVRITLSRLLRYFMDKLISCVKNICYKTKMRLLSYCRKKYLLAASANGFGLMDKKVHKW